VWGHGAATPYDDIALQPLMRRLRQALA